ncbi:hypothetical protein Sjap_004773 [Stephania japonica]|uniref:Probable purine permease n=1 Tax=Stephania japonica TaxID=461633 RepID=A0AAP0K573_9MAGN
MVKMALAMREAQELQQLHIRVHEAQESKPRSENASVIRKKPLSGIKHLKWWLSLIVYTCLLLSGQTTATLLGRLYYDKGGNSKWMATLVQSAGFLLLLIPFLLLHLYPSNSASENINNNVRKPSIFKVALLYVVVGVLMAGDNLMYSYGLLYLPVTTYSLLCATQLAFNAVFSFLINSQKFTALILNSLVLLTTSASLLAVTPDSANPTGVSKGKYVIGFICTLGASAVYALLLSLMQYAFQKIIRKQTFSAVLEMQIYPSLVASTICVVGLFVSGELRSLTTEMKQYDEGRVSYAMTLAWTAVTWQISFIGTVGLIFTVSALFSNVISTLALPIVPIFAVVFFNDKMNGVKAVALVLSIWGFASYMYQHYLDDSKSKATKRDVVVVSNAPTATGQA